MMDIEDDKDEEMMNEGEEDEDEDSEGEEAEKVEEGGALSSSFSSSSSCSFLDIAAESEESSDTDSQSDALSEMLVAMRSKSPAHLLEMLAVLTTPDAQLNMLTDAIQEFDSNWFHDDFVHVAQNLKAASAAGFPIDAVLKVLHAQLYSPLEANQFLRPTLFTRVEPIMRLCAENSNIDAKERMQGLQACLRSQNPGAIKLTRDALIKVSGSCLCDVTERACAAGQPVAMTTSMTCRFSVATDYGFTVCVQHHPNEPIESKLDKQCVKLVAAYAQISEARLASLTGSGGHDVSSSSSSCSSSSTARSWVSSSSSSSSSTADSIAVANRRLTEIALVNHEADICDEIQDKESEKAAHRHAKRKRAASDEDVVQCRTEKRQEMRDKDIDRELRLFRSDCERRRRKGVSVQSVTAIYEVYCQWRAARRSVLWAPATLEECRYNFQENILDETILQFPRNA